MYCRVNISGFNQYKEFRSGPKYDEIYFDNACWDMEEKKLRSIMIKR